MKENIRQQISKDAKVFEDDSWHSAEGHWAASRRWAKLHFVTGLPAAILSAIASVAVFVNAGSGSIAYYIAMVLTIFVAGLTTAAAWLNPENRRSSHQDAGNKYKLLLDEAHSLWIFKPNEPSVQELWSQLEALKSRQRNLQKESPQIPDWAMDKASKIIETRRKQYEALG